jgi:hypothetical protein
VTDIVERLRSMAGWLAAPAGGGFDARSVTEAADEIERLRAAGQAMYDVLDQMWKCGLRRDDVALAMDLWDGIPLPIAWECDR